MPDNYPNKLIRFQREQIAKLEYSLLVKVAQIAQLQDEKELLQARLRGSSLQLQLQRVDEDSEMDE